ncbi:hypothetical protein [Pseudomonas sp. SLFW]|uniref:hypothetical protein n=1 Tax=Pseudomonas sp. SLFW TaxID=2683259 RepID=UPI001412383D|nr:hypothetical protein [Pseudomonas sp. SLFW]NBB09675.1 hypothetical protein [Pseudomonas sp. SLFW]
MNANVNELHADRALSTLEHMHAITNDNKRRFARYQRHLQDLSWVSFADDSPSPGTHGFVLPTAKTNAPCCRYNPIRMLHGLHPGVHPTEPFASVLSTELKVTDELCQALLKLSKSQAVSQDQARDMCALIRSTITQLLSAHTS